MLGWARMRLASSARDAAVESAGAKTPKASTPAGGSAHDEWTRARGGFRLDVIGDSGVAWTLQGDVYGHPTTSVATSQPVPGRHLENRPEITDDDIDGGYVLFRAQRGQGAPAGWSLQGYYDRTEREGSRIEGSMSMSPNTRRSAERLD